MSYGTLLGLLSVLVVVGGSGLSALVGPPSTVAATPAPAVPSVVSPAAVTHGDLIVGAGQTFVIQPSLAGRTYFQGGNVTVLAGGTLRVVNVTLSFVQFVADVGSAQSRLSHIVHFLDQGTVEIQNSVVTTDVNVLNAYPKLNLSVTGILTATNSSFEFPGWVTVRGVGASLTLNNSIVTNNPGVNALLEPSVVLGDTDYAAALTASNGATINLFHATVNATYANNVAVNGFPGPAPLNATNVTVPLNVTNLATSNTSANLTRDWLYPGPIPGGNVSVWYNTTTVGVPSVFAVKVWFQGVGYSLASLTLVNDTSLGFASVPFSAALVHAINTAGLLAYLNDTGDFGSPSRIAVEFNLTSGPASTLSQVRVILLPSLQYNVAVSGAGTVLNAVDSNLDLTWSPIPTSPWATQAPLPWLSNKLVVLGGAQANLANLSVTNPIVGVFSTSAVLPDAASNVSLYRWAAFNLTGQGGFVPIYGATATAFYAYNATQANNATANRLDDLALTNPAIWGYVQYHDQQNGLPAYGVSGRSGVVSLLLASSVLNGTNTPDGNFVGTYHLGILLPIAQNNSRWFNWSVSPYPVGVAIGSPGYSGPDFGPNQLFPQYYAAAAFQGQPVVTADGSLATLGVRIGQTVGFESTIVSTGPAPITSLSASLLWGTALSNRTLATFPATGGVETNIDIAQGGTSTFGLSWLVNDSVTQLNGTQNSTFTVVFTWNPGNVTGLSGTVALSESVTVRPSQVVIAGVSAPPTTLDLSQLYFTTGTVAYNGSQYAAIELIATPVGGGTPIVVAVGQSLPGSFTLTWYPLQQLLSVGTSYTFQAIATYNGVTAYDNLSGTYSVPGSTSPTNLLTQTFLGLPLWIWLAIAGGAVLAIILVLLVLRRQAAGKLVECGECGNLIPEEATVCPKCGAEFEADLVRCSRCAATIPSNSTICPECAAQLLGTPGEAPEAVERQGYQDFTEKYRVEGRKELGENYNEGSFWDWWKRQPTYVSYSQWKLQQAQGSPRTGMSEPPAAAVAAVPARPAPSPAAAVPPRGTPPAAMPPAPARPAPPPPTAAVAPPSPAGGLKNCPSCGKEIPGDYLVCPFCGSVTQ